jgi:hypothetical protein
LTGDFATVDFAGLGGVDGAFEVVEDDVDVERSAWAGAVMLGGVGVELVCDFGVSPV